MEAMELYALATQMAVDMPETPGQRREPSDLFPLLEYLWERGVDLSPAISTRRTPTLRAVEGT
jgi:hypothetical protein